MSLLFAGRPCVDPVSLAHAFTEQSLPTDWVSKANIFRVSLGREHGRGWCLLAKSDIDAIGVVADKTLTFLGEAAGNETPLQRITLVGAQCLNPGAATDGLRVYLCELADRRYHLARIPINTAYNVRSTTDGGLLSPTLNAGTAWTWAGIVQDLWTALGLGTAPAMPFTPDGTPENLSYWGGWAWEAVNDVMDRIGCAIRYWPVTDTFAFVRLGVTDSAADAEVARLASQGELTWNSDPIDPARAWRPQYVRVRFARRPLPTDGSSPWYTVDVSTTATGVASGTYVQIDDDASALGATGTPSNSASLATRAAERAADWLRKRQYADRPSLVVYRDYQRRASVLLSSTIGTIVLDDRGGPRTQTCSMPDHAIEQWEPLSRVPKSWPAGRDGFFARLTTSTTVSGVVRWKWVRIEWNNTTPAWEDLGSESSGYTAVLVPVGASGHCSAFAGQRVWMYPSLTSPGYYECTQVNYEGFHARLTSTSGGYWKWVRVFAGGDVGSESATYNAVLQGGARDGGVSLADTESGQDVLVWMTPAPTDGYYQFSIVNEANAQYLSSSWRYYPGVVSVSTQRWKGTKTTLNAFIGEDYVQGGPSGTSYARLLNYGYGDGGHLMLATPSYGIQYLWHAPAGYQSSGMTNNHLSIEGSGDGINLNWSGAVYAVENTKGIASTTDVFGVDGRSYTLQSLGGIVVAMTDNGQVGTSGTFSNGTSTLHFTNGIITSITTP